MDTENSRAGSSPVPLTNLSERSTMASLWSAIPKRNIISIIDLVLFVVVAGMPIIHQIDMTYVLVVWALALFFTGVIISLHCIRIKGDQFLTLTMEKFLKDLERESPTKFTSYHLMLATNNYSNRLGSAGFGSVYKGTFNDGSVVAVKVLRDAISDKRTEEQFMAEVGTIGRVHHLNLVRLVGFCIEKDKTALVYEYMSKGSLDKYLFGEDESLAFEKLHEIAIGTAKGIAYLHEEYQERIIHYDIKPENILLDDNLHPKVADFGLAQLCDREKSHVTVTGLRGTLGYIAPEIVRALHATHKCDLYSFGIVLFEIIGRKRTFGRNPWFPERVWKCFESKNLQELMNDCGIEDKDKETAERMVKIALWCVQYRPELRPKMSDVVKVLEGSIEEVKDPSNPFPHLMAENNEIGIIIDDDSSTLDGTKSFNVSALPVLEIQTDSSQN